MHGTRKAEEGFTLLELLIAMVIGAGLVYLTSEVFSLIQRGAEQSRQAADQVMTEQRAITVVREALSNLIPPVTSDKRYRIVATESVFEFAAVPVDGRSQWGSMNTRIVIEPSAAENFKWSYLEQWKSEAEAHCSPSGNPGFVLQGSEKALPQYLTTPHEALHTTGRAPNNILNLVTLR
ncbi:MAG: type II secretion system protein [Nitrosomonas sp.]|nr:type II secretion system protein [Nitrosomonas sp.]